MEPNPELSSKFESYNFTNWEYVNATDGLIKCYGNKTHQSVYQCESQTEKLDDWLGPWICFLWFIFLLISIFCVRMIYKTFITFRDTLTIKDEKDGEYRFKEDCIYEHETAFGCWDISKKSVLSKCKIIYHAYTIYLYIAWSDLFLDISYISSFTLNSTRMISPFIEVKGGIFVIMGIFDILGTFRIFLCAAMLWKFSEKLYTQDEKLLAKLEIHMEMVVVAFAFILEDFAELFIEYFCVEKFITGYEYEKETAQSYMAAVSSISINLICLACFIAFVINFRKQQTQQSIVMNTISFIIPFFELVLSSLRTYRFLFQAFIWRKFRPECLILATNEKDENEIPIYKAYQDTFSAKCFRPLDWIMLILMCIYAIILIIFMVIYITKIRPQYNLQMANLVPSNIVGDPKKIPSEMVKLVPSTVVKGTEVVADGTKKVVSYVIPTSNKSSKSPSTKKKNIDYDPNDVTTGADADRQSRDRHEDSTLLKSSE